MLVLQIEVSVRKLSGSTAARKSVFFVGPTNRTSGAQGLFRWVRRRAVAQTYPVSPKMSQAQSAFP